MSKKEKAPTKHIHLKKAPRTKVLFATAIVLAIGILIGAAMALVTISEEPSLIQTSCEIDIQTLYEKPCETTEQCYGRLELCSRSLKKCITTVQVDKTDLRNIRIPDTQTECEANGGTWTVEIIPDEE